LPIILTWAFMAASFALALQPAPVRASPGAPAVSTSPGQSAYLALVERYRSGEHGAAVAGLAAWPLSRVGKEALLDHVSADPTTVAAAVLLHTETGMGHPSVELQRWHIGVARRNIDRVKAARFAPDFRRTWCLVMAAYAMRLGAFDAAGGFLEQVPSEYTRDPEVLLAGGSVQEAIVLARGPGDVAGSRAAAGAAEKYRRAIALAPGLIEARLRLGHVLLGQHRVAEATAELERVRRDAGQTLVAHYAALFLGRAYEGAGRIDQAMESYRAAIAGMPSSQAAHVSLGRLLLVTGHTSEATAAVERMFTESGSSRDGHGAWWAYRHGQLQPTDDRLARLRGMVRP
jgi:hypothetical protein